MGFFSTKKKTVVSVAATTVPLMGGETNRVREAVIRAILQKQNIADEILETSLNGYGSKFISAYNWAKDNYYLGLPNGTAEYVDYDEDKVAAVLTGIEGKPVRLIEVDVDYQSGEMLVLDTLYNQLGYNAANNRLADIPIDSTWNSQQRTVVLSEMTAEREAFKAEIEALAPRPTYTESTQVPFKQEDGTYVFKPATKTVSQSVELVVGQSVTWEESAERLYINYMMEYGSTDATGAYIYTQDIQHLVGKGFYTVDRSLFETVTISTDDGSYVDEKTHLLRTDRYSRSTSHIKNGVTSGGEQISFSVDAAELYYSVTYSVDGVQKHWLYKVSAGTYPSLARDVGLNDESPYFPVIPIRYNNKFYNEDKSKVEYTSANRLLNIMGLDMDYLSEALGANPDINQIDHAYVVAGVPLTTESTASIRYLVEYFDHLTDLYAPVQTAAVPGVAGSGMFSKVLAGLKLGMHSIHIKDGGLNLELQFSSLTNEIKNGKFGAVGKADKLITGEYLRLRQQLNSTQYREIYIYGLRLINHVYQTYTAVSTLSELSDSNEFVIPLHMGVVKALPLKVRNELYNDAVHMVLNSIQIDIVKVKWYQRGLGKALLMIGTIALALYGGYQFALKLGTAIAAGTAAAFIAKAILIAVVLRAGFKVVVKAIGPELAMILAAVAIAIGVSTEFGAFDIPFADNMLMAANGLVQGVQDTVADMFADLSSEIELFNKELGESYDALEEANKLLEVSGIIDPYMFVKADTYFDFNEAPIEFYYRTIHAGNIGTLAFDAITNFYDIQLTLPKPSYSFNGVV